MKGQEIKNLKRAPIREAIIDLRCNSSRDNASQKAEDFYAAVKDKYPGRDVVRTVHGTIAVSKEEGVRFSQAKGIPDSIQCFNKERTYAVRAGVDGFGFSRMKPYLDWNDTSAKAENLFGIYVDKFAPDLVSRTAVRFINEITLPPGNHDLKEFFRTTPELSPDIPQGLLHFVMKLTIPLEKGVLANLTQVLEPVSGNQSKLTFDIDVFSIQPSPVSIEKVWATLNKIRAFKNQIFFKSLTDKAIRMFE